MTLRQTGRGVNRSNLHRMECVNHRTIPEQFLWIYCINTRSVENRSISLCNSVSSNDFDKVAVIETRFGSSVDKTWISELVPSGYVMKHIPLVMLYRCSFVYVYGLSSANIEGGSTPGWTPDMLRSRRISLSSAASRCCRRSRCATLHQCPAVTWPAATRTRAIPRHWSRPRRRYYHGYQQPRVRYWRHRPWALWLHRQAKPWSFHKHHKASMLEDHVNYAPKTSIVLNQSGRSVDVLVNTYSDGLKSLVSAYAPLSTIVQKSGCPIANI